MRYRHPAAVQMRAGYFFDAAERPGFDLSKFREIDHRRIADLQAGTTGRRRSAAASQRLLDVILHIFLEDASLVATTTHLRNINPQFSRKASNGGCGMRRVTTIRIQYGRRARFILRRRRRRLRIDLWNIFWLWRLFLLSVIRSSLRIIIRLSVGRLGRIAGIIIDFNRGDFRSFGNAVANLDR